MALIGNCIYHTYTPTGETEEIEITNPNGDVQTIEKPTYNQVQTSYEDVYVAIFKIDTQHHYLEQEDGSYIKNNVVFVDFGAYESKDARHSNPNEPLFQETTVIQNYEFDENTYSQGYDSIKLVSGMETLLND